MRGFDARAFHLVLERDESNTVLAPPASGLLGDRLGLGEAGDPLLGGEANDRTGLLVVLVDGDAPRLASDDDVHVSSYST